MLLLVLGLVLFLGTHAFTMARGPRESAIERLGANGYKIAYSLSSLVGITLVFIGWGNYVAGGYIPVWEPPTGLRHLALLLTIPALILFVATYLPGHIKAKAKHPMLAGVKIWALAHLLANGDLGSILLFGSFLAWGVAARISLKRRPVSPLAPAQALAAAPSAKNDAIAVVVGLVAWAVIVFWFHPAVIGVAVMPGT